jgi:anaerobic magnesium-protoporphyrin IX monomethyl ester cyclase
MRVLFLNLPNPPDCFVNRDYCGGFGSAFPSSGSFQHTIFPPIFDAYAAAVLENEGHKVSILDCQTRNFPFSQVVTELEKENPDVVVCRICLPSLESDLQAISTIKKKLQKTVFVGWGSICKVEPEMVLKKGELDLVIRGELEFCVSDVLKAVEGQTSLNAVSGISFKRSGEIIHNKNRDFKDDLDLLPFPAYHLLDMDKYVANESYFFSEGTSNKFMRFFRVLSSRGCPFSCIYCTYPVILEGWRGVSPKRVVDELECLRDKYDVQAIWFQDQIFTLSPQRTMKICDEIINRGLDIAWACQTHLDRLPSGLIKKMRKAGCSRVEVGVETGNPHLLRTVGKRGLTIEKVEGTIRLMQKVGIMVEANFMVGIPGESWKTVRDTGKLISRISADSVVISITTPYPGTPLFKMAKKEGWLVTEDWSKYNTRNAVMSLPGFSDKDVKRARWYLYLISRFTRKTRKFNSITKNLVDILF